MQITHDLAIGGLQQVVVNLCRSINRNIFDISVLCLRERGCFAGDVEAMGIPVFGIVQKEAGTDYFTFIKVAHILKEQRIDVIHTHNTQPLIDGTLAAILTGVTTIVHTDHARDFPDKRRYMVAERIASLFVHRMVGVSEHTTRNLIRYERISPKKLATIANGIEASRFDIAVNRNLKKKELGIPEGDGPVVGLGVRLTEQKGVNFLLKAMPYVVKHFPRVHLVIAGEGPLENDLRRTAEALGLAGNVLFVGARHDIPELLKLFDLYVLPSLWEGMPLVLLEAMAAGCPILATNVGGVSSIIEDNLNGALVPPADMEVLADGIVRLLSDDAVRQRYAANGLRIFQQRFSASAMARSYEALYLKRA